MFILVSEYSYVIIVILFSLILVILILFSNENSTLEQKPDVFAFIALLKKLIVVYNVEFEWSKTSR